MGWMGVVPKPMEANAVRAMIRAREAHIEEGDDDDEKKGDAREDAIESVELREVFAFVLQARRAHKSTHKSTHKQDEESGDRRG